MENRKVRNDVVALGLLAAIIFLIAALSSYDPADPVSNPIPWLDQIYQPDQLVYPQHEFAKNACGQWGAWLADLLFHALGWGAGLLLIGMVALEIALFKKQTVHAPWMRTLGWTMTLLGATTLMQMLLPSGWSFAVIGPGGCVGALGQAVLQTHVGWVGALITAAAVLFAGALLWTEYLVVQAGRLAFTPAIVTATRLLPFGLLYRFVSWVNRSRTAAEVEIVPTDLEDEFEDFIDEDEEVISTIRFRRRDLVDGETEDEEAWEEDEELETVAAELDSGDEDEFEEEALEEDDAEEPAATVPLVQRGLSRLRGGAKKKSEDPAAAEEPAATPATAASPAGPHFPVKPASADSEREEVIAQLNEVSLNEAIQDYALPSTSLLLKGDPVSFADQKREALKQASILEKTCKEFGYQVKVVEVETGPVIAQYEIQLEAGLRLQKITALADDLAIALRVPSVRIVAPIPGKNTVGIEVPNTHRQVVRLREVMEQSEEKIRKQKIPLFLGKDAVGAPLVADLAQLPHLLIAGRTGTGKSVCLNAIISSILMTRRPDEVRMLMIDPKMVELSGYGRLPHLMHPVVTDMRKAEAILAWAVEKMEERYRLLARAGVRHLTSYNQLGQEELLSRLRPETEAEAQQIPAYLPFIVIVADEMADLMMTAGKEVEQHIIRLAQKSRAVGIHLILATQKPTVDVITGLIKSNLPARIAFQVASKMDSRVVLDAMGAEKLLGMGDMLFLQPGTSQLLRGQGTYLTDQEIDLITEEVSTGEQNFVDELVSMKIEDEEATEDHSPAGLKNRDDMYHEAVDVVVKEQRGSCSLLQRALGIGYGRAARLIDFMAEDGIVGDYSGSKAREVLLTPDQWEAMKLGDEEDDEGEESIPFESTPAGPAHRKTKLAANAPRVAPDQVKASPTPTAASDDDYEEDEEEDEELYEEEEYEDYGDDDYDEADDEEDEDEDEDEEEYEEEEYEDEEYEEVEDEYEDDVD